MEEEMRWNVLSKFEIQNSKFQTNLKLQIQNIQKILLKNRGIIEKEEIQHFLNPSLSHLERDFFDKKQLEKALKRITNAINKQEQIVIYSDYDVDGITGTAILWETLKSCGASVMPYVPHRLTEGYGLSKKGIDNLVKEFPGTKLVITVDNGISANEAVTHAQEKKIDVIVTDHHTKPDILPDAHAIIHTTELSGSGVALLFSRKTIEQYSHSTIQPSNQLDHLALAALGTIADLVPLIGANRVIASFGLSELNKTKRLGLRALIEEIGLSEKPIGAYEVGFMIGPRINASGRLGHALDALRLLCTKDQARAWMLARSLNSLNKQRQDMLLSATEHALSLADTSARFLVVAHESYHEGVIGLIAGNLVEAHYRPAIVLSKGDVFSKASARSIRGFNIVEAIRSCSELLVGVGGHPMAAGFTVETKNIEALAKRLNEIALSRITDDMLEKALRIDGEIPFQIVTSELYDALQTFRPYGIGNPEPVFATTGVEILDVRTVGRDQTHLKLVVRQGHTTFDAMAFGKAKLFPGIVPGSKADIAYSISLNEWNGKTSLQLIVRDIHQASMLLL